MFDNIIKNHSKDAKTYRKKNKHIKDYLYKEKHFYQIQIIKFKKNF
jgi:hypothetical protein